MPLSQGLPLQPGSRVVVGALLKSIVDLGCCIDGEDSTSLWPRADELSAAELTHWFFGL